MLDMPRQMVRTNLSTTFATLATVPTGCIWVVKHIHTFNSTGANTGINLSFNGIVFLSGMTVPNSSNLTFSVSQVLTAGQVIAGSAGGVIPLHIAGIEVAL